VTAALAASPARGRAAPPDPRPRLVEAGGRWLLEGARCAGCAHPVAVAHPRCPVCGGRLLPARFGPEGTVWASTVVRVPVAGRRPPYGLAYVDVDGGPRVLVHVDGPAGGPVPVGARVALAGPGPAGDPTAVLRPGPDAGGSGR
jgi:uncharacterized OB-fold protein